MLRFRPFLAGALFTLLGVEWASAANVLISEIMYHPLGTNVLEEWVELYNADATAVNLTGWQFTKGIGFNFPTNTSIPSKGFLVVAADKPTFQSHHPTVSNFVAGWSGRLSDNGDHLVLSDAPGQTVNEVTYAPEGDWATRRIGPADQYGKTGWEWFAEHDGGGKTLELVNASLPNSLAHNWATSAVVGGTPGAANSTASIDAAPFISSVGHFPIIPKSTDTVTVNARLTDEQTIGLSVTLYHRVDGTTSFTQTPMSDDGAHGDGLPNDGLFGATLPAQANGTIVEFYLVASDATGHSRTYPNTLPSGNSRTANLLYQVDNEAYAGSQPLYRLIMSQAEYDYLKGVWGGAPDSDAAANGTFIAIDGVVDGGATTQLRYNAAFRNRGHGTRTSVPHNFRVNLAKDRPWQNRDSINLNTQFTPSQMLGSALMRRAGIPMAESRAARVRINGSDLAGAGSPQWGAYAANEVVDTALVKRQVPSDSGGNLYRGIRDVYPGNPKADLTWHGSSYTSYTNAYFKQNNTDENNWTDVVHLMDVLNNTVPANYATAVRSVANVDEWMRYFAINTLMGNQETALATGYGDDFALYYGLNDTRALLLPYDMDSVLGQGTQISTLSDGLFRMLGSGDHVIPTLDKFMKEPEFVPLYYQQLVDLADTLFEPGRMNPVLDELGQGFSPGPQISAAIANMKAFNASQLAYVRSLIPLKLTVSSALTSQNGYPHTTASTVALNGLANALETRSVLVNGRAANWSGWEAKWSLSGVTVHPGINRVLVQSLNAQGTEVDRATYDIWYDDGSVAGVSGTLGSSTTWTATGGPYDITSTLTVANGATLTIEPGTTVYLASGANLMVANGGRILAEGTADAPIRFTRAPGVTTSWGGIVINGVGASPETRLAHVLIEFNGTTGIEVAGGTVYFDHLTFGSTDHQYLALDGASFVLNRCIFPSTTAPFELVHGTQGVKAGGHGIVRECFFGTTSGYNDVMDFTGGNRPGQPIIQYFNNVFIGGSDDGLDLDGTDAWVEGNIFLHIHKNGAPDSSSAVSGGDNSGQTSEITMIGNLIFDCDQAATAKQGNFFTMINNTIVHTTKTGGLDTASAVVNPQDRDPGPPTTYGRGFYLEGNIILDAEQLVRNYDAAQTTVTWNRNIVPSAWEGPGTGNLVANPLLKHVPTLSETAFTSWEQAQILREWFSLLPGSPAKGTGPNGLDQGGIIPLGASLGSAPVGTTNITSATLTVGINRSGSGIPASGWPDGAGYTHYKWRLDTGDWSAEIPIATPIQIAALANGAHTVQISGKRDSGMYQDDPLLGEDAVVTSASWTVDTTYQPPPFQPLRLNEVLAKNIGTFTSGELTPDLVELYNSGSELLDLGGLGLSDDATKPYKYTFPSGTLIPPGGYLVVLGDSDTNSPGIHVGFAMKQEGDGVFLTDKAAMGGALLDSIEFGPQIADLSIGRRTDGSWGLCRPTFGSANLAVETADPTHLKINEWLANARFVSADDFVELFNPESQPVALGGLFLSDAPAEPARHRLPPLSYIAAGGSLSFVADGDNTGKPNHLNFKLASEAGTLRLSNADLSLIDVINYGPQRTDISQGRTPNGADVFGYFNQPTPGASNPGAGSGGTTITYQSTPLFGFGNVWKYHADGVDLGTTWRTVGFSDTAWKSGLALLGVETSTPYPYPLAIKTALPLTVGATHIKTYYFRTHFSFNGPTNGTTLVSTNYLDDGAVYYLNGNRIGALRVADNPATYASDAVLQPSEGQTEIVTFPPDHLVQGDNLLAVEVHQSGTTSTDIVFGMALASAQSITNTTSPESLPVMLNEVFARNLSLTNASGHLSGWVELFNPATNAANLGDLSLSDDATIPRKWVFAPGTTIGAGGYLTIYFDAALPASATNTGFALSPTGGSLFLFQRPAEGGVPLDALTYGIQAPDFALGRIPDGTGDWVLTLPTRSAANLAAGLGTPAALRLNEWMADPIAGSDWLEVYNNDAAPVALGGLYLTDDLGNRTKSPIQPLSFIGTGRNAYVQFFADKKPTAGANHADFKLGKSGSPLGLFAASGLQIDALNFGAQGLGVSEGRLPDGAPTFASFSGSPTPNAPNKLATGDPDTDGDQMPDSWEDAHGLNKLVDDANLDLDGDGFSNLNEYLAGTDPQNSSSNLALSADLVAEGSVRLSFLGIQGRTYTIQLRDDLATSGWRKLTDITARPATAAVEVSDTNFPATVRFYRVVTPAQP